MVVCEPPTLFYSRSWFDELTTDGYLRFAVTTSTLTCPPGILSRTRARQMLALRVDYELDPRFREDDASVPKKVTCCRATPDLPALQ
jgi:hypothetical protein